jgi:hypothetical protein
MIRCMSSTLFTGMTLREVTDAVGGRDAGP